MAISSLITNSVGTSTTVRLDSAGTTGARSGSEGGLMVSNTSTTQTLLIDVCPSSETPTISATAYLYKVDPGASVFVLLDSGDSVWGLMDPAVSGTATICSRATTKERFFA